MLCGDVHCAGETLEDERARGGAFVGEGGQQMPSRNMPVRHAGAVILVLGAPAAFCLYLCTFLLCLSGSPLPVVDLLAYPWHPVASLLC